MGSEILLYGYGIVCAAMLVFNVLYNIAMKGKDRYLEARERRFTADMFAQLERIRAGSEASSGYVGRLRRQLLPVNHLIAFEKALGRLSEEDPAAGSYLRQIQPVFLQLARVYRGRDSVQAAYFAWFLSEHSRTEAVPGELQDILVDYMKKDSLYCRVNALRALYRFGSPEKIVEAVSVLDISRREIHDKILTDGLLSYKGDHKELTRLLWERFDSFSPRVRLAVLNFVRFDSGDACGRIMGIMLNPAEDKELRLSAIRYFGRYFWEPAKKPLLEFASDQDPQNWEYRAVSLLALAAYEGGDVRRALVEAAHSDNWYVRRNAAVSLEKQKLDYSDLLEVVGGNDRYAREMMLYQLESRRLEAGDAEEEGLA